MNYRYGAYALSVLLLTGASAAEAQVYYPSTWYGESCSTISRDLAYGARSEEVRQLQQFLVNRGYPGTGSWMLTGYFGKATEQAVRNFQGERGLPMTGLVDYATRLAMQGACAGSSYYGGYGGYGWYGGYPYQSYPYSYTYPYQYPSTYPYAYPYPYAQPRLDSLSPTSGNTGTSVTLYGSGFDRSSNTVRFGSSAAYGASSYNGTSLTVVVPNLPQGVYPVTVTTGGGVSNSLSFTVLTSGYYDRPVISSINGPTSLRLNETGTWTLSLRAPYNQYLTTSVEWGDENQYGYRASAASTYVQEVQSFTHTYAERGTYTIRFTVRNASGYESTMSTTVYVY